MANLMKGIFVVALAGVMNNSFAQQWWLGRIHRPDGENIVFNFQWNKEKGRNVWFIKNADERIRVDSITSQGDSLFIQMPVFESQFRVLSSRNYLSGSWIKSGASASTVLPFTASPGDKRFEGASSPGINVSGRWSVTYENDSVAKTVAEFKQSGSIVTGTFIRPTGDFRYLEGIIKNDSMLLSSFDGSHAFLFRAALAGDRMHGIQFSGAAGPKQWVAVRDAAAGISESSVAMHLRPGQNRLHFSFRDLDGRQVSISDDRFKSKVVIVQLMGSWCPNCMDETAFLSDYYNKNRQRGIEVVALAYEYTTDRDRSVKSLRKFQQRFDVRYPMLITGVTVQDSLRTEKTLPELTDIKVFPSSVIIDKKGIVRKLDTGFVGPGTGAHYTMYKKDFEETIDKLLSEK